MEKKEQQIKFRLSEEMKTDIEILAARKDVSASWIIREAIKDLIEKEAKRGNFEAPENLKIL